MALPVTSVISATSVGMGAKANPPVVYAALYGRGVYVWLNCNLCNLCMYVCFKVEG
jgi:hypothetical protein